MRIHLPWSSYAAGPYTTIAAILLSVFVLDVAVSTVPKDATLTIFGKAVLVGHAVWVPASVVAACWFTASLVRQGVETHRARRLLGSDFLPCKRCGHPTVIDGSYSLCCECGRRMPTERLRKNWEDRGMSLKQDSA